ncbi:hypothetical protein KKG66_09690 [bacterium]|nr:hypothetical protein [bacterium]MBU1921108.1 hypothetical protein [bacterium]
MPIHSDDKHRYPPNWKVIRAAILKRATNSNGDQQCECRGECGLHHGKRCSELNGYPAEWAKGTTVLTIAHLDHNADPDNHSDANLKAMCQRCHLRYDSKQHQANARKTRRAKKACGELL